MTADARVLAPSSPCDCFLHFRSGERTLCRIGFTVDRLMSSASFDSSGARRSSPREGPPASFRTRDLIIHGVDAAPDQFPFFAFIGWGGGALVAPDMVLTAGHCLPERTKDLEKMTVQVGKYYRNDDDYGGDHRRRHRDHGQDDDHKDEDNESTDDDTLHKETRLHVETFRVARAIQHPHFQIEEQRRGEDVFHHDYLLLQLDGRSQAPVVSINRDPSLPRRGDVLTVAGMGWIQPDWPDVFPSVLQTVPLDYLPNEDCARSSGRNMSYRHKVQDWHLCTTGGPNNERDACAYDSGSPILMTVPVGRSSTKDQQVLVGMVSWGEECADADFPGVNARVSAASDWIDAVVCEYSDDPPEDFACATRKKGSIVTFDQRHGHLVEILLGLGTMVLSLLLLRWCQQKRGKARLLPPTSAKHDGFQPLSRHGSNYSYDSVGSCSGVEIMT